MQRAIVIIGGFTTSPGHYNKMAEQLLRLSGLPVSIVPISMGEWPSVVRRSGWRKLLLRLEDTLAATVSKNKSERILIVAHSLGGIVTRLYLSPHSTLEFQPKFASHIERVITLGTPHRRGVVRRLTVWKGLGECLAQDCIPVPILSVVGAVDYSARGRVANRAIGLRYRFHGADAGESGDGIIPVNSAIYDAQRVLTIPNARHDFRIGHPWYGDPEIVQVWWERIKSEIID